MAVNFASVLLAGAICSSPYIPTADYGSQTVEGFVVLISPDAARHPAGLQALQAELEAQLRFVSKIVPDHALAKLRRTRIWVEWTSKAGFAAEFHSSRVWLAANRCNPEKFGGVEISNPRNFLAWSKLKQNAIVLHELAHAYLSTLSDYDQLTVHLAYLSAVDSGKYERVRYHDGQQLRAYALTDAQEYFAELTEAYLSSNDFYPFVRSDVHAHDPQGYEMLVRVWGPRAGHDRGTRK